MKKIKFAWVAFILCAILGVLLTGCSGGSKPSNKQILEDLEKSFSEEKSSNAEVMDIDKFQVELSESGEKTYVANLLVTAKSKSGYAEIYWTADIEYFKYDQGWRMEDCDWDYESDAFKVVKYPNKAELTEIITKLLDTDIKLEKFEILKNESKINCQVRTSVDWCEYASGELVSHLTLEYSRYSDSWIDEYGKNRTSGTDRLNAKQYDRYGNPYNGPSDEYNEFTLKTSLTGTYSLKDEMLVGMGTSQYIQSIDGLYVTNGSITISNVTKNGFNVRYKTTGDIMDERFTINHIRTYKDFVQLILQDDAGKASFLLNLHEESWPYGTIEIFFDENISSYRNGVAYANNRD